MERRAEYTFCMSGALEGLNSAQVEAVTAREGRLLVVAGPGTGKTLTIVRRIAHLVDKGSAPEEIVAVTFTNRAAREMRERTHGLMGDAARGMFIGTFHMLGMKLLRQGGGPAGAFSICTREEQIRILKPLAGGTARARAAAERISRVKNGVEALQDDDRGVFEAYRTALFGKGMLDFDDLILHSVEMLEASNDRIPLDRLGHIIVDEYQDISPMQYRLLKALAREGAALCAVGDPDQAIYAFRGADVRNFLDFANDFGETRRIVLEENYRSTGAISGAGEGVIGNNRLRIEKRVTPRREEGSPVIAVSVPDERAEAETIVREIEGQIGGTSHYRLAATRSPRDFGAATRSFADFAVLFRTNAQARVIRETLEDWGMPCQVVGDRKDANRKAIIDRLRDLSGALPDHADVAELLRGAWREAGGPSGDGGLIEALAAAYGHLPLRDALADIVNELTLATGADAYDPAAQAVTLLTIHAAKGLEFKTVFMAGCEEGLLPYTLAGREADLEEERRLFYVGMTRARDELFLFHARSRFLHGQRRASSPSPFFSEIPGPLLRREYVSDRPTQRKRKQESLF